MNENQPQIETKLIRVYQRDNPDLMSIKKLLYRRWGRKATYADAVNFLMSYYLKREVESE